MKSLDFEEFLWAKGYEADLGRPAECFDFLPVRKMDGALVSEFDGYSVDEIGLLRCV